MKKLYIVHGWAYDTEKWQQLMEYLPQHNIEPIMLHVPGLTKESKKVWDLDGYVDWLSGELKASHEPVHLLGHSNGGRISIAYASKYPARVKQLFLVDSAGVYHNELPLRVKRKVFKSAASLGKKLTKSPKMKKLLYKAARAHDYEEAPDNMRQTMVNLNEADKSLDIGKVISPTVLIWGKDDSLTPLGDGKKMHQQIKDSKLWEIEGARHAPFATHAKKVGDIIVREME